jgi:hypothetical protein
MAKKAVIMISLVEEAAEKSNLEIEKEIMRELSRTGKSLPALRSRRL